MRKELFKNHTQEEIDNAIANTPASAGIPAEEIDKIAMRSSNSKGFVFQEFQVLSALLVDLQWLLLFLPTLFNFMVIL